MPPRVDKLLAIRNAQAVAARLLAILWLAVGVISAAPVVHDTFESAQPTWRLEPSGVVRPIDQQRMRIDRDGDQAGVEWLRYACRPGYSAVYWHALGRAPVLDELKVSLTMRCELPGAVLAARVVMPRAIDASTGKPRTILIRGDRYEEPGQWRTLTLADTPRRTAGAARLLRAQPGTSVDERGAYVDRVVLVLPGSANGVSVWTDDLQVDGVLLPAEGDSLAGGGPTLPQLASEPLPERDRVTVSANGFTIGGRPFFPRVWTHHGGALEEVQRVGFNTVAFNDSPTAEQLAEAKELKLRVICPPPSEDSGVDASPVIAWLVGQGGESLDAARVFAERTRNSDLALQRPLIAAPEGNWSRWSRIADALTITKRVANSPAAERLWVDRASAVAALSRPGTPILHRVTASLSPEAIDQLTVLVSSPGTTVGRDAPAIAADVWSAVSHGVTGVWIDAGQRLSSADASSRQLQRGLTLLNLQLQLADPWLAGGTRGPTLADSSGVARAALLKRGRVRLLVPSGVAGSSSSNRRAKLVVPGVSESSQAYRLTPAGVTPLPHERVAGGVRIDAGAVGFDALVLLTDDRPAVSAIAARAAKTAAPAVEVVQQLARDELLTRTAAATPGKRPERDPVRRKAERRISISNAAAAARNYSQAYASAAEARRLLSGASGQRVGDPLLRTPLALLSGYRDTDQRLGRLLAGAPRGANLLAGGDFEDLNATRTAGWANTTLPMEGVDSTVELSTDRPGHGKKCLRLSVASDANQPLPLPAGDCPVWITTPATELVTGQLVEVTGWVRVESTNDDRTARMIISDTLGGEQLGRVVEEADKWRQFRLLRRAPRDTELRVTFGLSGVGAGYVDAVMIRPVQVGATPTPPARLRPATPVANKAAAAGRAQPK